MEPSAQDRGRVILKVDGGYQSEVLLSESFPVLPGRSPAVDAVSNFLGGYVPEGNHRDRMAAKRRIDKENLFSLLTEFGGSIAGAVTLRTQGEQTPFVPNYEPLDDDVLEARLLQALMDSDQGILDDSRSTLPGYQPKVLVAKFGEQWVYPRGRAHSTYILKPQVPARPARIFDEYYSHQLSRRIGLSRYGSEILFANKTQYLAIERFDRTVDGDSVGLLHQEDLAQALALDWRDTDVKFQTPDWPDDPRRASNKRIGILLASLPSGGEAVRAWIRQLTFHIAIGNNDAHAKNVALVHSATGTELSQLYDALPNFFQEGLIKWDLALAVNGLFDHRKLSVEHLLSEIASWGVISDADANALVIETLHELDKAMGDIEPPVASSQGMVERLQWNTNRLLSGLEIGTPNP